MLGGMLGYNLVHLQGGETGGQHVAGWWWSAGAATSLFAIMIAA